MLAAHDQENRVFARSVGGAGGKPQALQPKTPGAKFPKTPLGHGAGRRGGGMENFQTINKGKAAMVTPVEPRTARAPLGNKTTNAKGHMVQQQQQQQLQKQQQKQQTQKQQQQQQTGVKQRVQEIEKTQTLQTQKQPQTVRRARVVSPRASDFKLAVLSDELKQGGQGAGGDDDIEHGGKRDPVRPYESDVFPADKLTFAGLQPQNRLRGYYDHYYRGSETQRSRDQKRVDKQQQAFARLDQQVQEDLVGLSWEDALADTDPVKKTMPKSSTALAAPPATAIARETVTRPPSTLAARRAASALALSNKTARVPGRPAVARKATAPPPPPAPKAPVGRSLLSALPLPPLRKTSQQPTKTALIGGPGLALRTGTTEAASRTTLGYNKGRSALSMVKGSPKKASSTTKMAKVSGLSVGPAAAVTATIESPTKATSRDEPLFSDEVETERSPAFLSIFDVDPEQDSLGFGDAGKTSIFGVEDDDYDDFQLDVQF